MCKPDLISSRSSATTTTQQQEEKPTKSRRWIGDILGYIILTLIFMKMTGVSLSSLTKNYYEPVLPGDTILVTGSSSGIGKHATLSLIEKGFTVFACVRKEKDGQALLETANKLELDSSLLKPILMDVTNTEQIQQAVKSVTDYLNDDDEENNDDGRKKRRRLFKGLFNNAGGMFEMSSSSSTSTSFEHLDMEVYKQTMDVNYFGAIEVTKAFLPLLKLNKGSRILMNTSIAGIFGQRFMSAYCSSKFALEGFSDSIRRELLSSYGIYVSILEPGYISTPILNLNIPESIEPYVDAEQTHWNNFIKGTVHASTPKVTSDAVIDAMLNRKPKSRYVVGTISGIVRFVSLLPTSFSDYLLSIEPKEVVTEEDITKISINNQMEYEL